MDLNFEKMNGLIPAIIQDNSTSKVLIICPNTTRKISNAFMLSK